MYSNLVLLLILFAVMSGCTGKTSEEFYKEGVKALQEGRAGSAIVLFRSALDKEQNSCDARYQLAQAYVAVGKYELAEREFQKVLRLNPSQPGIQLELARLYNLMKKPDAAIAHAEEHLAADPDSTDALEVKGSAYLLKAQPQVAESFFLRALQKNPEKQSARLELAELYLKQNKPVQAQNILADVLTKNPLQIRANYLLADAAIALGNKKEARSLYQKLSLHYPDDPKAPYKAGLLDLETGNAANAEKIAGELISRFPKNAEGYRLKGFVLFGKNEFPEAITALQSANKMQPSVSGYYFLGLSLYGTGALESALSQFRLILDRAPAFQQARLVTAAILLQQKRFDDAIIEVNRLIDADDDNALAYNLLGSAYLSKGMFDEGMKAFDRSIKLNPKLVDTYLKKGMIHLNQGKTATVETDLATAVRVAPDAVQTRIILSAFHLYRNNRGKALHVLSEGLNGQKSDAALYAAMARIMFSENRSADGISYLQKAKEKDPAAVDPYFILAGYYTAHKDIPRARNEYSSILAKEPGNLKAQLQMAALLESENRQDEALALYLKAKETQKAPAYLALARYHEQRNRLKEAKDVYAEAVLKFPRSIAVLEQQGRLFLKMQNYAEALRVFGDLEAISPDAGTHLLVGTYLSQKNFKEAENTAKRAISLRPDAAFGYQLLASVYTTQNSLEPAIAALKQAVERDHTNPQPVLALAALYLRAGKHALAMKTCSDLLRKRPDYAPAYGVQGTILDAQGEKKEAVKKYRAALALSGSYLPALNNLAFLCADGFCSKEEALRLAESAKAVGGNNPEVIDTFGYALLKNGRLEEARSALHKAEVQLPGNPTINYHLALVYRALGEQQKAVERLQVALRSKDFNDAAQAKSLLGELN